MSSHFASGTSRRASPAYCLKGMWDGISATIDEKPARLNILGQWSSDYSGPAIELVHLYRLLYDPVAGLWSGEATSGIWTQRTTVTLPGSDNRSTITHRLLEAGAQILETTWSHEQLNPEGYWNTGILETIWVPDHNWTRVHIRG